MAFDMTASSTRFHRLAVRRVVAVHLMHMQRTVVRMFVSMMLVSPMGNMDTVRMTSMAFQDFATRGPARLVGAMRGLLAVMVLQGLALDLFANQRPVLGLVAMYGAARGSVLTMPVPIMHMRDVGYPVLCVVVSPMLSVWMTSHFNRPPRELTANRTPQRSPRDRHHSSL